MPSADRDDLQRSATQDVLTLGKRTRLSKRGPVPAENLGVIWINHSKEQTQQRISVTVPITKTLGVIKTTWGQMR
jgi:hypothetical protein